MDLEYSYLFEELLRRCKDQKVIPTCQLTFASFVEAWSLLVASVVLFRSEYC